MDINDFRTKINSTWDARRERIDRLWTQASPQIFIIRDHFKQLRGVLVEALRTDIVMSADDLTFYFSADQISERYILSLSNLDLKWSKTLFYENTGLSFDGRRYSYEAKANIKQYLNASVLPAFQPPATSPI